MALLGTFVVTFFLPLKPVQGDMRRYVSSRYFLVSHDDSLSSKLLMIDYVGVLLTVGACTMIMLPLVWVSNGFSNNSRVY